MKQICKGSEFTTMELFAGVGGGIIASKILGHTPLIAIEQDDYCCRILRERSDDGCFPNMQVWEGDIRVFDPSCWVGRISCINAGFPCQDISFAGNQAGIDGGTRSSLYREVIRIGEMVRPEYIFLENVAAIVSPTKNYLEIIGNDLNAIGYDAIWTTLSAAEVGANHKRNRWWCLAKRMGDTKYIGQPAAEIAGSPAQGGVSDSQGQEQASESTRPSEQYENVANTTGKRLQGQQRQKLEGTGVRSSDTGTELANSVRQRQSGSRSCGKCVCRTAKGEGETNTTFAERKQEERKTESGLGRMANDVPTWVHPNKWNTHEPRIGRVTDVTKDRVARLKALGNGQVPLQAAVAFSYLIELTERLGRSEQERSCREPRSSFHSMS